MANNYYDKRNKFLVAMEFSGAIVLDYKGSYNEGGIWIDNVWIAVIEYEGKQLLVNSIREMSLLSNIFKEKLDHLCVLCKEHVYDHNNKLEIILDHDYTKCQACLDLYLDYREALVELGKTYVRFNAEPICKTKEYDRIH